jgi:hypothetical protein
MSENEYQKTVLNRLSRIESLLTGDNTPERGVIVRLDRVEREIDRAARIFKWFIGATTTVAVGVAVAWLAA